MSRNMRIIPPWKVRVSLELENMYLKGIPVCKPTKRRPSDEAIRFAGFLR